MRTSASRESAQRRLTALRGAAARLRARDLAKVLAGVAAVLFCLQLVYLAAANLLLKTQAIQRAVASSPGFVLEFADAYSLWPGHVHVRDLSLRVEDYNVQFEVALDQADVDIALGELPFKKFHITRLSAQGTRFRMRHKLIAVGEDVERVAAYPPIKGFADPPYFVGVREPPTPDADYDLWSVRIQNVIAQVSELWVMEYRFQGRGLARGSFVVQPERWVQVEPASLTFEQGTLRLGSHLVAQQMRGQIACDIPDMHVQASEGVQVLREILATAHLELQGGNLDFLQAYLARLGEVRYGGRAQWLIDANVARGVVQPGTRVELRATPGELHHPWASLAGDVMLSLGRRSEAQELELAVAAPRLLASSARSTEPAPILTGLAGSLKLRGVDLKQELSLGTAGVALSSGRAPSLSWFAPKGTALSGSAEVAFELARDEKGALSGSTRVSLKQAELRHEDLWFAADAESALGFQRASGASALELHQATLQVRNARVRTGDKHSEPFAATVDASGMQLDPNHGGVATGSLRLRVSSTEALLPLLIGAPFKGIASSALDLQALDARATFKVRRGDADVRVVDATSGNVRLRGYLSKRAERPRGAFLLSSGPINVGVTLSDGETEVSPFVSDDWLLATWPRLTGPSPG